MNIPRVRTIAAAILLLSASAGRAETDGVVFAVACGEVPRPLGVEIALEDDSRESLALRDALEALLAKQGVRSGPESGVRLTLETALMREGERRKGFDMGEFRRGNQSDQRTQFRVNLWSSSADSLITGRRQQIEAGAIDEIRVAITLNDKASGRCLWQGEALYDLKGADPWPVAERLLPRLIERFGRGADRDPIRLD